MAGCADVCLDMDFDDVAEFARTSIVKARKAHRCCECSDIIEVGARYEYVCGRQEGEFWTAKTCLLCLEIRRAFVCGSWVHGQLWEEIENEMFPVWDTSGPIDCLAKLDTVEARQKARQRYGDWKGAR